MSVDLGDLAPLSIQILNAAGQPEDATSVSVTITLPDGTTETHGPIPSASPGAYDYDYMTVQAGRHHARWVATGLNASAYTDSFDVAPADDGDFISLTDAIEHLKKKSLTPDAEKLRVFISAACQMITDRMGQVSPATVVHDAAARRAVVLPRRPVISITTVQRLPGLDPVPAADEPAGVTGWVLDSREGVLSGCCGRVRVTYRAGRSPLPANFRLAALELVAHLWRTSQLNAGGGRPGVGVDEVVVPGVSYALPYNVRQLLGLDKRPQAEIVVG
jgi:hypothetical protein